MAVTQASGGIGKPLLAAFIAGALMIAFWISGAVDELENQATDLYVELFARAAQTDLVIVEIDSASIEAVGSWPWPRTLFSEAIARLETAGIASLMIDVDFSAHSTPENDAALALALASLSQTAPVYLPTFVQRRSAVSDELMIRKPLPDLASQVQLVSVNMHPESDGLVRRLSVGFEWQGQSFPGAWNAIAQGENRGTWIDFSVLPESFDYVSFHDLISGAVDEQRLRGKDVLIGATAIELGDILAVPIHRSLPGVVIQALGTETLNRGGLYRLGSVVAILFVGLVWLLSALVFPRLSWTGGLKWLGAFAAVLPLAAVIAYFQLNLILSVVAPFLAAALVYVAVNFAKLDAVTLEHLWLQITLRDREAVHSRIMATANDCILCVDTSGRITRANPAMQGLSHALESALVDAPVLQWLPDIGQELTELSGKPFDTVLLDSAGKLIPVEATISTVDLSVEPLYTIVLRDLSERIAREKELEYQATHDALTGLLNRTALFDRINTDLKSQLGGTVLSLNLDYFHEVNDTYGHDIGDYLLGVVANRLTAALNEEYPDGCVARVGGDGFAFWLPGAGFEGQARRFCDRLMRCVERRVPMDTGVEVDLQVFCTIGGAEAVGKARDPEAEAEGANASAEELLRNSADALRLAKGEGIAIHLYSSADRQAAGQRLKLVPAIHELIQADGFNLVYQPKIDLTTGEAFGCEALLRWPQNHGAMIPVNVLIEVAENSRQIGPLTFWVVRAILRQERDWQAKGLPRHIAVNISARLLQDAAFVREMNSLLASSTGYFELEFEITETALMSSHERAIDLAAELLNSGGTLAIDDFGTGYSSLAYLKDLHASVLKIDRSFVTDIENNRDNQTIVRSTIKMAHELGMKVVAEGIETEQDEAYLKSLGCDYGQGYYYARPLSVDDLERWQLSHLRTATLGS